MAETAKRYYVVTHCRASPWLAGIFCGYIMVTKKSAPKRVKQKNLLAVNLNSKLRIFYKVGALPPLFTRCARSLRRWGKASCVWSARHPHYSRGARAARGGGGKPAAIGRRAIPSTRGLRAQHLGVGISAPPLVGALLPLLAWCARNPRQWGGQPALIGRRALPSTPGLRAQLLPVGITTPRLVGPHYPHYSHDARASFHFSEILSFSIIFCLIINNYFLFFIR